MRRIKKIADRIFEELADAKHYAEEYVDYKVKNDTAWANKFKAMASEELNHASILHELAVAEIAQTKLYITPPESMVEKWERTHAEYVEEAAWIKQMLQM